MTPHWTLYQTDKKIKNVTNQLSRLIIAELGQAMDVFFNFNGQIRPKQTRFIKDTLALMGHNRFKYKVYANGLSPELTQLNGGTFRNSEWLYDLHWYQEGKDPYTTVRLPLVMECEWQQKRKGDRQNLFSGIKYDFQKLLVTNAELRLMIFKVRKPIDLEHLTVYFINNINNYQGLEKGACFLFVAFSDSEKTFYYFEVTKV